MSLSVEPVEKVLKQTPGRDTQKSELIEAATINDLMLGKGQMTPENIVLAGCWQLTHFNTPGYTESIKGVRCIVSDSTWAPDGRSICACVAWVRGRSHGVRLVRIELE